MLLTHKNGPKVLINTNVHDILSLPLHFCILNRIDKRKKKLRIHKNISNIFHFLSTLQCNASATRAEPKQQRHSKEHRRKQILLRRISRAQILNEGGKLTNLSALYRLAANHHHQNQLQPNRLNRHRHPEQTLQQLRHNRYQRHAAVVVVVVVRRHLQ